MMAENTRGRKSCMKFWKTIALMCLAMLLAGCGRETVPETTAPTTESVQSVRMMVTEDTIGELEAYPDLKQADLSGSDCYEAIVQYQKRHPEVEVRYDVAFGSARVSWDAKDLTLENTDFESLRENLSYLPRLVTLKLSRIQCTPTEIQELHEAYPKLKLTYTVELLGKEMDWDTEELDLSGLQREDVAQTAEKLPLLTALRTVELMDEAGGCDLTPQDVAALQAGTEAHFHYVFDLFGKQVSTDDERIEFRNMRLGEKYEDELRQGLEILRDCDYLLLENCRFDNELLAQLRDEYRGRTKIVWRIYFAKQGSCLTDRTILRYVYNVTNSTVSQLKYCEDVEYIDFGHNDTLRDWSWAAYMPNLKAIIVSGSMISDLTPFASCKNLEFLELSNCGYLTDLTPLAQCTGLQRLNISNTKVEDLSPLEDLPNLECLVDVHPKVSREVLDGFAEAHPNCVVSYEGYEYGYPWRYNEDGSPTAYYAKLIEVFHYPDATDTLW